MTFKAKLLIIQGGVLSTLLAMLLVAHLYITLEYQTFLYANIQNEITHKQQSIQSTLSFAQDNIRINNELYRQIHQRAIEYYHEQENIQEPDLETLKNKLQNEFLNLRSNNFDVFLINRNKVIFDGTLKKDIGYDLSGFDATNKIIEETFSDNEIHISDMVSQDLLSADYKAYSYAKINDDWVLELSFIDTSTSQVFDILKSKVINENYETDMKTAIYCIYSKDNRYFYFQNGQAIKDKDKQQIYDEAPKFLYGEHKNNNIMKAFFTNQSVTFEDKNLGVYKFYNNLFIEGDFKSDCHDLVVEYNVSLANRNSLLKIIQTILFTVTFISLLMLLVVRLFVIKQLLKPLELIKNSILSRELIPTNKLNNSSENELFEISEAYNLVYQNLHNQLHENAKLLYVDSLTKIGNRKAFDERFESLLAKFEDIEQTFSIILFDIDNFKQVNDSYGHSVGDNVLIFLSEQVNNLVRHQDGRLVDNFYRVGGEEFVILLADTELEEAVRVANRVRCTVAEYFQDWETGVITVSMGVAEVTEGDTYESMYKRADSLLYTAKHNGKNQVCS